MTSLRPELEALPKRLRNLPIDERGYPVPWFVEWIDGKLEFRALDPEKYKLALYFRLCWVCGERLGRIIVFTAGPMCGVNRTSSEPPAHRECAEWSARNCPFLNNPHQTRRHDERIGPDSKSIGGEAILRNPGVVMLWVTEDYSVFGDGKGGVLIHMGEPLEVVWYARGKLATREEVVRAIETGIPALESMAVQEKGGLEHLAKCKARLEVYLPA